MCIVVRDVERSVIADGERMPLLLVRQAMREQGLSVLTYFPVDLRDFCCTY